MSRFTKTQCTQVVVFCLYWFAVFPVIWFVIQPEFFADNVLLAVLFALLLVGIYYLIYRIIKCCCTPSAKTPLRIEMDSRNTNPNSNHNQNNDSGNGNENTFANGNGVYFPTTTAEPEERTIEFPNAVLYENTPARQSVKRDSDTNNDDADDDDEEPFIPQEETKAVRYITSCALYYDGQGHFYDYK